MLGQMVYCAGHQGRLRLERKTIAGLPVFQAKVDPDRFWAKGHVKRAGRLLARAGTTRVLVPEGFGFWPELERSGLRRVDPFPFLRGHAAQLAVAALRRRGEAPEKCAVALRNVRVDRDLARAAQELCPQVRDICIAVPRGGEELEKYLRWEFGVAVCPDFEGVPAAVRFDDNTWDRGGTVLDLFPPSPQLGQVEIRLSGLEVGETEYFPMLTALWETGKVEKSDLKFT